MNRKRIEAAFTERISTLSWERIEAVCLWLLAEQPNPEQIARWLEDEGALPPRKPVLSVVPAREMRLAR